MGKHNVFNLGGYGVNLVDSPLHLPDGAWRSLQNAEPSTDRSRGGLKKRGSLTRLNSVALAGSLKALANVPLPLNTQSFLYAALNGDEDPHSWKRSEDGSSWTNVDTSTLPIAVQDPNSTATTWDLIVCPTASFKRALYYPGDDYVRHPDASFTDPPLLVYTPDGGAYELVRIPPNPTDPTGACIGIVAMAQYNGIIYLATADSGGVAPDHKGRVLSFDPVTGVLAEIGNRFGDGTGENTKGFPCCFASYQGRLFVGTYGVSGNNQGRVYSILAGSEDTWATDYTGALHNGYIHTLAVYKGKLYAGTDADSSGTAIVLERSTSGTYSTSFTAPVGNQSRFTGLIVFNDCLYVGWRNVDTVLIKKFDGSSWTTDLDVTATYAYGNVGLPVIFKDELYWPIAPTDPSSGTDGFILKCTTGGVWSQVLTATGVRGHLNKYAPDA